MSRDLMKLKFDEAVAKRVKKCNSSSMSVVKYRDLLDQIKIAKSGQKKINRHYWLLKHYEMVLINGEEKLISPIVRDSGILFYVTQEELFDVLYEIHDSLGHAGRDRMKKEIQRRYKNITIEDVSLFLSLCETCRQKKSTDKTNFLVKPRPPSLLTSRCQIELIDYSNQADGAYKYTMVYQDKHTKFVILRPLKSEKVEEVAREVLDIFLLFGAPNILQSELGRDFCKRIIENLKTTWPQLKIVHGKPKTLTGKERKIPSSDAALHLKQEIKTLLTNWMQDNLTNKWTNGLPFVQFTKNRTDHPSMKKSPYQAMFGHSPKMGLNSTSLPRDVVQDMTTEEDLEKVTSELEASNNLNLETLIVEAETRDSISVSEVESFEIERDVQCDVCRTSVRAPGSNMCLVCLQQCQMNNNNAAAGNQQHQQHQQLWLGHRLGIQ